MTTITELKLSPSVISSLWIKNIVDTDANSGVSIVPAVEEYTHIIKSIIINTNIPAKWIKILDGENVLIGPVCLAKNVPFELVFESPIYCTAGNAIVLQTEATSEINLIITGKTIPPPLEAPISPSPEDGAVGVDLNPTFSWDSSPQVLSSTIYINGTKTGISDNSSYSPNTLKLDTAYTWRVDDSDGNNTVTGDTWTFDTNE